MIIITDTFSLGAVSNKGEGFNAVFQVRRIKAVDLKETIEELKTLHTDTKSIVSTKKAADDFTKLLGIKLDKFSSKLFAREDFMRVNKANVVLFGEMQKDEKEYFWYLISLPEGANPNQ